jgi:hypothetical protein
VKVRVLVLLVVAVSFTCARPKPKPEAKWPPRVKNSAPEKSDALTAAGTPRNMEVEQQRWGIEAAEDLKADKKAKAQGGPKAVIPMPPPNEEGRRPDAGASEK